MRPRQKPRSDKDGEGREKQRGHPDGVFADAGRAAQVPRAAKDDDSQRPEVIARGGGEGGAEFAEVEDEDGGVESHIEDAGREREPAFLVAPERPEAAAHPDVEAAFVGDGGGEFADHERGGQAPDERDDEQNNDGPAKARATEDVLHAVRAPRHHEKGGGDQGQKEQLIVRMFETGTHTSECTCNRARQERESNGSGASASSGIIHTESRRDGREAEGGGLLNRYRVKSSIGGSNPPLSARTPSGNISRQSIKRHKA